MCILFLFYFILWSRNQGCQLTLLLPPFVAEINVQRQRRTGAEESDSDAERETSSSTNTLSAREEASESSTSGSEASGDEGEPGPGSWCQERLLFEFLESEPPYQREPLADKACHVF